MYAHVTSGVVDSVGPPPQLVFQDGRWWDLRDRDPATLALVGWYPVTEAARPADTATTRWEPAFTFNGGTVTQSWVEVPKSAAEIQAQTEQTNRDALLAKARNALTVNATYLGVASPTNAQNLAQIRALTRQVNALIKLEVQDLLTTDGT